MMKSRLNKIGLQCFRSFGIARQDQALSEPISVFWGGNSQGKTSFAEALEFLFTGQISRRELLASAKDEFAEALRNVHIDPAVPVVVEAHILCSDGEVRRLTRTLVGDYRRGSAAGCVSKLEIDGTQCTEQDLETKLGLRLSHPPLRAPVLAQHTLGYLFSASPTERAGYFRAILDTQDLENFRLAVASLQTSLKAPDSPELENLTLIESIPALASSATRIRKAKTEAELQKQILANTSALLENVGITPLLTAAGQANQVEKELERRRAKAFPLSLFGRTPFAPWDGPPKTLKGIVDTFLTERGKVDAETKRLADLFALALSLPDHQDGRYPRDCPLCGAENTFTVERVQFIRGKVMATETYASATTSFKAVLQSLIAQLDTLSSSASQAQPKFMRETAKARRDAGFRIASISNLVPDQPIIKAWFDMVSRLWRAGHAFNRKITAAQNELRAALANPEAWTKAQELEKSLADVRTAQTDFEACLETYKAPAETLGKPLKAAVDQSADTKGWDSLISISRDQGGLWKALMASALHAAMLTDLTKALNEIDTGNGKVLDEKFDELSKDVRVWWERLRPDEPAFFNAVQRRSRTARRTIDLKVGLSATENRSDTKVRDAIAVFSQSQLHCLGMSLFLARAVQEQAGFIVLDDPVLTSDDDYRPNFATSVIKGLLDEGIQVIICTQDYKSWKDIGERWGHRGVGQFLFILNDVVQGTTIRSQNDDLAAMLAKARPLIKSQDPEVRKEGARRIREAIERFCKMILVKDRQAKGEILASITDYDGKNFGNCGDEVMAMLIKDRADPGKLKASHSYVTPGPHDDAPPSTGQLTCAFGDLKKLIKDYLD